MASVYKLPIAIELLAQVSAGTVSLIGRSRCAERHPRAARCRGGIRGGGPHRRRAPELMITESDNTASDAVRSWATAGRRAENARSFDTINESDEGDDQLRMTGVVNPLPQAEDARSAVLADFGSDAGSAAVRRVRAARRAIRARRSTSTTWPGFWADCSWAIFFRRDTTLLLDLMARSKTGPGRLKAQAPDTIVAHKTGTTNGINDVGLITLTPGCAIGDRLPCRTNGGARPRCSDDRADLRCVIRVLHGEAAADAAEGRSASQAGENAAPFNTPVIRKYCSADPQRCCSGVSCSPTTSLMPLSSMPITNASAARGPDRSMPKSSDVTTTIGRTSR